MRGTETTQIDQTRQPRQKAREKQYPPHTPTHPTHTRPPLLQEYDPHTYRNKPHAPHTYAKLYPNNHQGRRATSGASTHNVTFVDHKKAHESHRRNPQQRRHQVVPSSHTPPHRAHRATELKSAPPTTPRHTLFVHPPRRPSSGIMRLSSNTMPH